MSNDLGDEINRGPKGARKHQPGRGHDKKSGEAKMKTKTVRPKPAQSRSLAANAAWKKIIALADKLCYSLRFEWNKAKVQRDSMRLAELIDAADRNRESILGEGCRSLIAEAEGNIPLAIEHRKKEVEMIRNLHATVSGESFEEVATRGLDPKKLQQTMLALSRLYLDNGEISNAIQTLQEARSYSEKKGLALDESPRMWRPNARQKQVAS